MRPTLTIALLLTFTAATTAQERQKAEAIWKEGKMTIEYGAPTWKEAFTESMAKQKTWRMGQNDPTSVKMTCALMTEAGAIPAGSYSMAMKKNAVGKWDLVVYKGGGFFNAKMKHWTIGVTGAGKSDASAEKLTLDLDEQKQLAVRFGPHTTKYSFKPIKMLAPITAEFARMPVTIDAMAMPIDGKVNKLHIGSSTVVANDVQITWNMLLTIDGDTATIAFENTRAKAIEGEKKAIEATIERVTGMLEGADEARTKRLKEFLGKQKKDNEDLVDEASMLERFKPEHSTTGKVTDRSDSASTLTLASDRIEGAIVLKFGAGKKTATFTVKPSEFRVRRRRR